MQIGAGVFLPQTKPKPIRELGPKPGIERIPPRREFLLLPSSGFGGPRVYQYCRLGEGIDRSQVGVRGACSCLDEEGEQGST